MKNIIILILFFIFININGINFKIHDYLYINVDNMPIYYLLLPFEKISNDFIQVDCSQ